MIKEKLGCLAPVWIEGEPKENGLYLLRFDTCTYPWYYLFEARRTDSPWTHPNQEMIYLDNRGGDFGNQIARRLASTITHHCAATAENFQSIIDSLGVHTFNRTLYRYELKEE